MLSEKELLELKERIFKLLDFNSDIEIKTEYFEGVSVKIEGNEATLGYSTRVQLARAIFLLALNLHEGKTNLNIRQTPRFKELGVMLQVQTPLKIEFVIKYMETMAALGYTYIWLYMETSYEVKGYPFFGYMRGRYTAEELKRIDEEGTKLGLEVIPCIQTFGHLDDYLRWGEATPIKDSPGCLLADCEETYKFIEALISTVSGIFRSRRVHIGFDETKGMGLGRYLIDHDYPNRTELFCRHLSRVKEICEKYGLKPTMWSDMPFRLGGDGYSDEYDTKSVIPEIVSKATAGVDMCFWDYYTTEYEPYNKTLKRHQEIFPDSVIVFAGGVWILDDHIMNMPHTLNAATVALEACIDNKIENVNATVWGSAGNTNMDQSIPGLAVFSEYCYLGRDCTKEDIYRAGEFVSKLSRRFIEAVSEFQLGHKFSLKLGSRLIWCDVLYELMRYNLDYQWAKDRLSNALEIIKEENVPDLVFKECAETAFKIAIMKCTILKDLRSSYKAGNKEFLNKVANELIDELIPLYHRLNELRVELWMRSTTPFGVEKLQIQYAGMIERLKFAKKRINQYLNGEISVIEELEEEILDEGYVDWLYCEAHTMTFKPRV